MIEVGGGQIDISSIVKEKCCCGGEYPYICKDGQPCICAKARYRKQTVIHRIKNSQIPKRYRYYVVRDIKEAERRIFAEKYITQYKEGSKGLWISGGVGVGKTFFASVIMNELIIRNGISSKFISYRMLVNSIKSNIGKETGMSLPALLSELKKTELIIIDDLVVRDTEFEYELLYMVTDLCYVEEKTLLITTNESLEDIYGGRISSRIAEMTDHVKLKGKDKRRCKPKKKT